MKTGLVLVLIVLLTACEYNDMLPAARNPLRETSYDDATGVKLQQVVYEYNPGGKITSDITEVFTEYGNYKNFTYYEYDNDGNLSKRKARSEMYDLPFVVQEYTYENGLKSTMTQYYEGRNWEQRTQFYYSFSSLPDSSVFSSRFDSGGIAAQTTIYSYDEAGHLVKETTRSGQYQWENTYEYEGNNLVKECLSYVCYFREYNDRNQIIKLRINNPSDRLAEEYFYEDGLLNKKLQYRYETYDTSPAYTGITRVEIEY